MLKKQIVISVLSKDRPGIIADVSNVIYDLEGDLADMSQSVLNGYFSMIILAYFDEKLTIGTITQELNDLSSQFEMSFIVKETGDSEDVQSSLPEGDIYVVTAQGKNRTGLVAAVSAFCRDRNINIIGYETKLSGSTYSMMLDILLPESSSPETIHDELEKTAGDLGLKLVMQHKDLFETVNEISLV